ncbi:MAG TPA: alkaline phosphatase family protein [Acidimicrobiales bacterium]|nr:alkaline phosphatase family protein [Acidimicrobiales bacterium]
MPASPPSLLPAGRARLVARLDRRSGARRLRRRAVPVGRDARPDPQLPPGTDRVPAIRHVVVLMMENHSFDNYLGCLGRGDGLPAPAPTNAAADGRAVAAHHFPSTVQHVGVPSQSWRASHIQWADGRNDGFARAVEDAAAGADPALGMGHWDSSDLPYYHGLAATFPLADRWFCSCLGPTFPNRRFLLAATANGLIDDAVAGIIDYPSTGTIFDLLNRYGITWANYHHVPTYRMWRKQAGARAGRFVRLALGGVIPWVDHRVRGDIRCTANLYPLGLARTLAHLRHVDRFFSDAASGSLPAVSVVDPDFASSSEENPQDIRIGESFAADVIEAVMSGPGWPETLLVWLYDEHGGYFDHVPPPSAVTPDDVDPHSLARGRGARAWLGRHLGLWPNLRHDDDSPGRYDRLGFRVPAVVVSPYARPGFVSSQVHDHTSVLKLIEEKWNLPSLTRRDAAAVAPWEMIDLAGPPAFLDPPDLPAPARPHAWRQAGEPRTGAGGGKVTEKHTGARGAG